MKIIIRGQPYDNLNPFSEDQLGNYYRLIIRNRVEIQIHGKPSPEFNKESTVERSKEQF